MRENFSEDWKPKFDRILLDVDARIDSAVFHTGAWAREYYERFSDFMDRFHVAGWKRALVEMFSEGATLGGRRPRPHAVARPSRVSRDVG